MTTPATSSKMSTDKIIAKTHTPENAGGCGAITKTTGFDDFHGGIHPPEMKSMSNERAIEVAPLPPVLIVPVQQHIGKSAKLAVSVGDQVLKGQVIAEADGFVSANVHAPTSGVIKNIDDYALPHPSGQTGLCVEIEPDGQDSWCELIADEDYLSLAIDDIQAKVRAAGITGMGGAGFPTDIKLSPPAQANIDTLILNAAECEPYITADDRLIRERADQVVNGLTISAKVLGVQRVLIGIEDNKPEAIKALEEALAVRTQLPVSFEICVIPTKYPSGGEKQLIQILTGKEVPSGKIPADLGIVCQNVGTVVAVYRAVRFGEPLISRITTLTGTQVAQCGNVEVLLGTPIDWLLSQYGYQAAQQERLIMGGPMMGFTLPDAATPIVKTTNCILAPSEQELPMAGPAMACIRCGLCAEACPATLLPQQLYWFARAQEYEKAEHHNLFDCIECGACSYVCPSEIPLVQYYRHAKGEIKQHKEDHLKSDQARIRFEARQARLEREAAEKEAKRKARAEAAAKAQAAKRAAEAEQAKATEEQALDSDTQQEAALDPKKAAVAEALARAQAKTAKPAEEAADPEALKAAWDKAQAKLEKMLDALENAKQNTPEQVDKLTRAVEKNQMRVNQAQQAYEEALKTAQTSTATDAENTAEAETQAQAAIPTVAVPTEAEIDALKTAHEKAESKLAKMEDALANADAEQVEKLTRAVDKNKVRVQQAKQAWDDALAAVEKAKTQVVEDAADSSVSTSVDASVEKESSAPAISEEQVSEEQVDALNVAFEKAEAKLAKMEDALANADSEQVEKLTRAVDKNKVRVEQAKTAYEEAKQQLADQEKTAPVASDEEIEALSIAVEKAESKLAKMEDALANAAEDQVEKLTRAVEKNRVRVDTAKANLAAAKGETH